MTAWKPLDAKARFCIKVGRQKLACIPWSSSCLRVDSSGRPWICTTLAILSPPFSSASRSRSKGPMLTCNTSSCWPRAVPIHIHGIASCTEQVCGPASETPVVGEIKHGQLMHAPQIRRGDLISRRVQLDKVLAQAEHIAQHRNLVACRVGHWLESTCWQQQNGSIPPARPPARPSAHTHARTHAAAHTPARTFRHRRD